MQQYFIDAPIQATMTLENADILHHMYHVMRMEKGARIALCGSEGACYEMEIESLNKDNVSLKRLHKLRDIKHTVSITLAQALIRKTPFELTLQKGVELGMDAFIPLETDRTVVKINAKDAQKKHARFEKIVREASEQSRRSSVPEIHESTPLERLDLTPYTHVFMPYENETTLGAKDAFQTLDKGDKILLIIGPEGGFSDREIKSLKDKGATSIALGPRILRSETASLYALSALSYELETR